MNYVMPFGLRLVRSLATICLTLAWITLSQGELAVSHDPRSGGFPLVATEQVAQLSYAEEDFPVVKLAVEDLARDIERVTGRRPALVVDEGQSEHPVVYIGTLGSSSVVDTLLQSGKIDTSALTGQWESYLISVIDNPAPGVTRGLAIVGSDRRGTAYGVYELAQAIGVSPWHWWADVPPKKAEQLFVTAEAQRFGPPSVRYRGIFINDEDWGLHPWASQTFDPKTGNIGPKTYEKVFELMLRLKANTLWPAMHEVTKAFNLYPANKELADRYGIVMGSSHAEPLLRNNVGEWTAPHSEYNYHTNREGVLAYWEERLRENASFENIYTLGMRGIHDSGITAGTSVEEKVALLQRIIGDQRDLLRKHVDTNLEEVSQVFTPYKEVLELYEAGLDVPDEVTLMWPDDNHGFIRRFPDEAERARSGGSGVYYHLSYLGSPMAYLWLYTTPPALVWEEMSKAYELGARDYWIANVGDIKPGEMGMEFFLQMAWDIDRWNLNTLPDFIDEWASREFGENSGNAISSIFESYFELNYQRRPEHLQWWLPHQRAKSSTLSAEEIEVRLEQFSAMIGECEDVKASLPAESLDAYFQLVEYPVKASAYANRRYFHAEQYGRLFNADPNAARIHGALARRAESALRELTEHYNEELAGGKWRRMMAVEPADNMWRSYRMVPPILPAESLVAELSEDDLDLSGLLFHGASAEPVEPLHVEREAESFNRSSEKNGASWRVIPGLGRTGDSIAAFPVTAASVPESEVLSSAPWVEYDVELDGHGEYTFYANLIPTFPVADRSDLRFAVGIGDQQPVLVSVPRETGDENWKRAVLSGTVTASAPLTIDKPGKHALRLYMVDTGVVVDKLFLHQGEFAPRFLGPDAGE